MAKEAICELGNVSVLGFDNLLVDFAKSHGINTGYKGSSSS